MIEFDSFPMLPSCENMYVTNGFSANTGNECLAPWISVEGQWP